MGAIIFIILIIRMILRSTGEYRGDAFKWIIGAMIGLTVLCAAISTPGGLVLAALGVIAVVVYTLVMKNRNTRNEDRRRSDYGWDARSWNESGDRYAGSGTRNRQPHTK